MNSIKTSIDRLEPENQDGKESHITKGVPELVRNIHRITDILEKPRLRFILHLWNTQ